MKTNKTEELRKYLLEVSKTLKHPGKPDCHNRHPGKGWSWSPSQTATKAAPSGWVANCWHGSAPTPGTQMPTELAAAASEWLKNWEN